MHEPMNAVAAAVVLMGVAVVVAAVVVGFAFAIRAASREPERPRAPLERLTDRQLSEILDARGAGDRSLDAGLPTGHEKKPLTPPPFSSGIAPDRWGKMLMPAAGVISRKEPLYHEPPEILDGNPFILGMTPFRIYPHQAVKTGMTTPFGRDFFCTEWLEEVVYSDGTPGKPKVNVLIVDPTRNEQLMSIPVGIELAVKSPVNRMFLRASEIDLEFRSLETEKEVTVNFAGRGVLVRDPVDFVRRKRGVEPRLPGHEKGAYLHG
jgi:hypothetical protein